MENDSFVFYKSFLVAVDQMTDAQKLETIMAICRYGIYGQEPELTCPFSRAIFEMARPNIDANVKRRTNGAKGGRPKGKTNGSKNKKPMVPISKTNGYDGGKPLGKTNEDVNVNEDENIKAQSGGIETGFSANLQTAFEKWLAYKRESRHSYKPTGLATLITKLRNYSENCGEQAVVQAIDDAIANGYSGIVWDKLKSNQQTVRINERGDNRL